MKNFHDKVVVVTGAGSGMGRDMSIQLARAGARLAISDVNPDGLAETEKLIADTGAQVHSQLLNVAEREAVLEYADTVAQHYGTVNAVINNAGIAHNGEVESMEFKDIERIMDVDYWGVVNGTKAFLPYIIASGDGAIVNVSSLFGILSQPGQSAYNSAKFAVRGFTESLRQEMLISHPSVKVTCVHPGGIKTAIARNATASGGNDAKAGADFFDKYLANTSSEKAAEIILTAVRKEHARVLVGADAKTLDVLTRLSGSAYQGISARLTKLTERLR
ncbi:MAG: SDR family NAD(P)-dependent oxidoreductase [Gordonia sp. (in: high G+C Gram-positive bacteria)]|uniref:SDR family NAD(P)-dependent oxidoreductase n=1 Tax=Gordonia sp. (in: high G+C Gram-positive bacteria) TaxID=84139 RepID=UPI0039E4A49D